MAVAEYLPTVERSNPSVAQFLGSAGWTRVTEGERMAVREQCAEERLFDNSKPFWPCLLQRWLDAVRRHADALVWLAAACVIGGMLSGWSTQLSVAQLQATTVKLKQD